MPKIPDPDRMLVHRADLVVRDAAAEGREMVGLACPYNTPTPVGTYLETLAPGVFAKSIKEAARGLPLLMMHDDTSIPVGKSVNWSETRDGLVGTWRFDTRADAVEAARLADEGLITGLSVGFMSLPGGSEEGELDGVRHVTRKQARLCEVSMVPTPAYASAQVMVVRSAMKSALATRDPLTLEWLHNLAKSDDQVADEVTALVDQSDSPVVDEPEADPESLTPGLDRALELLQEMRAGLLTRTGA